MTIQTKVITPDQYDIDIDYLEFVKPEKLTEFFNNASELAGGYLIHIITLIVVIIGIRLTVKTIKSFSK